MRLLLDQNLSVRLLAAVANRFPRSQHVAEVGLARATDAEVWDYARSEALTIVSKDGDFHHLSLLRGPPPKVIWLRAGNCTTAEVALILLRNASEIEQFIAEPTDALLLLRAR